MASAANNGNNEDVESVDPSFMRFDQVIGCIEDVLISEEFVKTQHNYLTKHCNVFDDNEENKLIYTTIFQDYAKLVENFLEQKLGKMIPSFSMEGFAKELIQKQHLEGDVFDVLREFTDFQSFKDMMVDLNMSQEKNFSNLMLSGFKIREKYDVQ